MTHSSGLSPKACALVRRLLRSIINPCYDQFAPPEKVVRECNDVGLLIQEEHPLGESRFGYPLNEKEFRQRALEMGFTEAVEAEGKEGE